MSLKVLKKDEYAIALPIPYLLRRNSMLIISVLGTSVEWKGPPFVNTYIKSNDLSEPVTAKITLTFKIGLI